MKGQATADIAKMPKGTVCICISPAPSGTVLKEIKRRLLRYGTECEWDEGGLLIILNGAFDENNLQPVIDLILEVERIAAITF